MLGISLTDLKRKLLRHLEKPRETEWVWCITAIERLLWYRVMRPPPLSYHIPHEVRKRAAQHHIETWEEVWHLFYLGPTWRSLAEKQAIHLSEQDSEALSTALQKMDYRKIVVMALAKAEVRRGLLFQYSQ